MAALPFATVRDLADWVGQDIAAEDRRAQALLKAASVRVRTYVGADITDKWDDIGEPGGLPVPIPDVVTSVTVQVAARVWINPQGLTTEANDDYTRRFGDDAKGGIYLTKDEQTDLNQLKPSGRGGLSTISTTRGEDELDQYLDTINPYGHETAMIPFLPPGV